MIRVNKDFDDPPAGLVTGSCQKQRQKALVEKAGHKVSGYHYRDSTIEALRIIYKYKCGYCETHESAGATLRVDHYRPKAGIKEAPAHEGYYWLAYEWSNLILSCEKCNGRKLHNFPLQDEANRINEPILGPDSLPPNDYCRANGAILLHEKPLLLNPELDSPDEHLVFLPNGTVDSITDRGTKSIELYFLQRDKLIESRKNMTDDVVEDLKKHLLRFLSREIDEETYRYATQEVYEKAALNRQVERPYSRVVNALFENFNHFVVLQFSESQRPFVAQSFKLYQQGKLWPVPE